MKFQSLVLFKQTDKPDIMQMILVMQNQETEEVEQEEVFYSQVTYTTKVIYELYSVQDVSQVEEVNPVDGEIHQVTVETE